MKRRAFLAATAVAVPAAMFAAVRWKAWFPPTLSLADLDAWIYQLDDENREVRLAAIEQLASWKSQARPAVPTLKSMVRGYGHYDPPVFACLANIDPENVEEYRAGGEAYAELLLPLNMSIDELNALKRRTQRLWAGVFPPRVLVPPRPAPPTPADPRAIAAEVERLKTGSVDVRSEAARQLARYGTQAGACAPAVREELALCEGRCTTGVREVGEPQCDTRHDHPQTAFAPLREWALYRSLARALRRIDPDLAREAGVR